jgi:hypothetical protein
MECADRPGAGFVLRAHRGQQDDMRHLALLDGARERLDRRTALRNEVRGAEIGRRKHVRARCALEGLRERRLVVDARNGNLGAASLPGLALLCVTDEHADLLALLEQGVGDD